MDVNEQVLEEIKKVGATSKENIDELRSNYESLKKELAKSEENSDVLIKTKMDKLVADISTRQEAIDTAVAESKAADESSKKRMDELDIAMQRHKSAVDNGDDKAAEELKTFVMSTLGDGQVKADNVTKKMEELTDAFPEYKKAFDSYLRVNGREGDLKEAERKALSVGSEADGGFAVTPFMSSRIIERLYEVSPIRSLASSQTITTDALEMMVDRFDTTSTGWESETIAGGETDTPKMAKLRIPVHVLYSRPTATQQLLEDSSVNVESWLGRKVADKMGRVENTAFVSGDGIGKPRGFLTYASGTDWGQIEQINSGAAAALTADFFVDVKYGLKEQYLNRGTWLMNRTTVAAAMKLKDGSGAYIWKPSMIANDPSSTILGAPVRMSTDMPAVAANALAIAYGDFAESYMIVDRLGMTIIRDPYTKKPFVEFYFRRRLGGDVVNFEALKIGKIAV